MSAVVRYECPTDHLHRLAVRDSDSGPIRYCTVCKTVPLRTLYVTLAEHNSAVAALRRIAAGDARPSKIAGEALDALDAAYNARQSTSSRSGEPRSAAG